MCGRVAGPSRPEAHSSGAWDHARAFFAGWAAQEATVEQRGRMNTFLMMAGGCVVVGVGCHYLGTALQGVLHSRSAHGPALTDTFLIAPPHCAVPEIPREVFQQLGQAAALATVVCLGQSAVAWFNSNESDARCTAAPACPPLTRGPAGRCLAHYRRVRQAQTMRYAIRLRLEEAIDKLLFAEQPM